MIRSRSTIITSEGLMSTNLNDLEKDLPLSISPSNTPKSPVGSRSLKLLLFVSFVGIFAYLFIFVGSNPIRSKIKRTRTSPENFEKLTIVMNTFKRNDLMTGISNLLIDISPNLALISADAIDYYSSCDLVKNIYVVWSEKQPPPSEITKKYSTGSDPKVLIFG